MMAGNTTTAHHSSWGRTSIRFPVIARLICYYNRNIAVAMLL